MHLNGRVGRKSVLTRPWFTALLLTAPHTTVLGNCSIYVAIVWIILQQVLTLVPELLVVSLAPYNLPGPM